MKKFLVHMLPLLAALSLAGCPYRTASLKPEAVADRILLDVAAATNVAQQTLAEAIRVRAAQVRASQPLLDALTKGYDCLPLQGTSLPLVAAEPPRKLTGEPAGECYFRDQMAAYQAVDEAIQAFKIGQKFSYQQVRAGTRTARAATKETVGGIIAVYQSMVEAGVPGTFPQVNLGLIPLGAVLADICFRGSELYVDLQCDAALARAMRGAK